jgi:hypothetical protein
VLILSEHSYEELRGTVVDILLRREKIRFEPHLYANLLSGVAEVLARRGSSGQQIPLAGSSETRLHDRDSELVRDIFWDLFRQGFITLGKDDMSPAWPFFRLSRFGDQTLAVQSPYRFHDKGSFMTMVRNQVPDISPEAVVYLDEAVATFYSDSLLACCVMLGVAAEAEFLRLVDVAAKSATYGPVFAPVQGARWVREKITKFQDCLRPLLKVLPKDATEDLEINFLPIQSVLRIARNEAGHPTGDTKLQREQVYVYLQLFVPFARQLMRLRAALS